MTIDTEIFTAPCTGLETMLAKIWRQVLEVDEISIHDNFFDLGGNSKLSARLARRIEQDLNLEDELSPAMVYELTTIAAQAEEFIDADQKPGLNLIESPYGDRLTPGEYKQCMAIAAGRPAPRLHPESAINVVSEQGNHPTMLFCANSYDEITHLTSELATDRPFYMLESGMVSFIKGDRRGISALAAHHVRDITRAELPGPFIICGYSFATFVAYELAQQLSALGHKISALIILDTCGGRSPKAPDIYEYHPYREPFYLIAADDASKNPGPDPRLGWPKDIVPNQQIISTPGDHFTMLKPPLASRLTCNIKRILGE